MDEQIQTKKPRPKYEWVIIAVVLVVGIVVAFGIYTKRDTTRKARLLISELSEVRSAVATYKMLNRANPPSLETLTRLSYAFEPNSPARPYLKDVKAAKDGKVLDPFGNTYAYDAKTGWTKSATKGYENW